MFDARAACLSILAFAVAAPVPAVAQIVERPARPFRGLFGGGPPPDPNRTRQELTLTSSLFAGYDDILTPGGGQPTFDTTPVSGFTGYADAALQYWKGRTNRSFEVQGRGYGNAYSNLGLNPSFGGNVWIQGQTPIGRRNQLSAGQAVSYDPFFAPGTGPLIGDLSPEVPSETVSTHGLTDRGSWRAASTLSMTRQLTPRRSVMALYEFNRQRYLDIGGVDNLSHAVQAGYESAVSRTASILASYRFTSAKYEEELGGYRPLTDHSVELGAAYEWRLSRNRQVTFSGGGGAAYVGTVSTVTAQPIAYWTPSGHATVGVDLGRSWLFSLDYGRGVSVLDGISLETFVTDSARISLGGYLGPRVLTTLSGDYSNGAAGAGGAGRYRSLDFNAQLEFAVTRWCAAVVLYNHYDYRLHDITDLEPGVPDSFDRNAVRVGVTFWLPLHGSYTAPSRPQPGSGGRN
jgi:hypothetical protein